MKKKILKKQKQKKKVRVDDGELESILGKIQNISKLTRIFFAAFYEVKWPK